MNALRLRLVTTPDGSTVGVIEQDVPDDAPAVVREGLARRALTADGRCPCGAELVLPNRAERRAAVRARRLLRVRVQHEDNCPAIAPEVAAWRGDTARNT